MTEEELVTVTLTASPAPTALIRGSVIFADSYAGGNSNSAFVFNSGETSDEVFLRTARDGENVSRTLIISLDTAFDDSYAVSSGTRTVTINDGSD